MTFETPILEFKPSIKIEKEYRGSLPKEFLIDPITYFEKYGKNIKSGEVKRDKAGRVREDPTAVKDLPTWQDGAGNNLEVVGKRINTEKGKVGESGDPFYEYNVLKLLQELGLPGARPIVRVEQGGQHIIVMEKIKGLRVNNATKKSLREEGYSDADIETLKEEAEQLMVELQKRFEQAGIIRQWKLADMVFDIDLENKKVLDITPTDWERTKIDKEQLRKYNKEEGDSDVL